LGSVVRVSRKHQAVVPREANNIKTFHMQRRRDTRELGRRHVRLS